MKKYIYLIIGISIVVIINMFLSFDSNHSLAILPILPILPVAMSKVRPLAVLSGKIKDFIGKLPIKNDNATIATRNNIRRKMFDMFGKESGVKEYMNNLLNRYNIEHKDISKRGRSASYYNDKLAKVASMAQEIIDDVFPSAKERFEAELTKHPKLTAVDNAFIKAVDSVMNNKLYETKLNVFQDGKLNVNPAQIALASQAGYQEGNSASGSGSFSAQEQDVFMLTADPDLQESRLELDKGTSPILLLVGAFLLYKIIA